MLTVDSAVMNCVNQGRNFANGPICYSNLLRVDGSYSGQHTENRMSSELS